MTGTTPSEAFPLSAAQRHLLVWSRVALPSVYRVRGTLHLRGPVDGGRLAEALARVIAHHEALRTRLEDVVALDLPVQVIQDETYCPLRVSGAGSEFGPLVATLDRGAISGQVSGDASPLWVESHLHFDLEPWLGDPGTLLVLGEALGRAYAGLTLIEAPQAMDVASWREQQQGKKAEASELVCVAPPRSVPLELGEGAGPWRSLLAQLAAPPTDVLLAVWTLALAVWSGRPAVSLGVRSLGREDPAEAGACGLLAELRSCELSVDPQESLERFVHRVQVARAMGTPHVWAEEESGRAPFAFVFEAVDLPVPWRMGDVNFEWEALDVCQTPCLAGLFASVSAEGILRLRLDHDPQRVVPAAATALGGALRQVLVRAACGGTQAPLSGVCLGSAHDAVAALNRFAVPPSPGSFLSGVREAAAEFPDRVAVRQGSQSVRFADLVASAERWGARLREDGIGRGDVVAVLLERTPDIVIVLLGIASAGAAFLPLDRSWPPLRCARVQGDAGAVALITSRALDATAPPGRRYFVDDPLAAAPFEPVALVASDLAYVLYTSGSRGAPKGVLIDHGGLHRYLSWAAEAYRLAEGSGALVHTSVAFDLTLTALLAPLLVGQQVILLPETRGVEALAAALHEGDVSLLKLTPTHLRLLAQTKGVPSSLAGCVRTLVVGGEPLRFEDLAPWLDQAPETRLFNEYGPTEAVVGCCVYEATSARTRRGPVPIGRPVAGARAYLLDAALRPVAPGVEGELCIGGPSLATGYVGRAEETTTLFRNDPFVSGGRLYRTGDRARLRLDGELEFLGRLDRQAQMYGHRVEPAEIEAALREHPAVAAATVVVEEDGGFGPRLIAYWIPAQLALDAPQLRAFVGERLPSALVPSCYVALDTFPLTPNGKLDLAALPPPPSPARDDPSPGTHAERALALVWSQVLGSARVGLDDDYFALGGDSIRSLRVVALARAAGWPCTVAELFAAPTVRQLAALVAHRAPDPGLTVPSPFSLLAAEDRGRLPPGLVDAYPLTDLQGGMVFHGELEAGAAVYHDIFSYELELPVGPCALRQAARGLTERHPALRTRFALAGFTEPLQLVEAEAPELLAVTDLRDLPQTDQDAQIAAWIAAEKSRGFALEVLPLVRLQVHLRGSRRLQFTISFHHAVLDGWSDVSLLTELFTQALAIERGAASPLLPPATTPATFVALERSALRSADSTAFWQEQLDGSRWLRLPRLGEADPPLRQVEVEPVEVSEALSSDLHALARTEGVPVKTVLLAAHMCALATLGGTDDVLGAVVASVRPEGPDADRTLGLFINSIPLRLRLPPGGSWRDLVQATFALERDCLPHARVPFGALKRRQGGEAIAETLFYFTHYHLAAELLTVEGFRVREMIPHEVSSFSLVANFWLDPLTERVQLSLAASVGRITTTQLQGFARVYRRTLEALVSDPGVSYESCDLLGEEERRQVLAWSQGGNLPGIPSLVHDAVRARAEEDPTAVALIWEDLELTRAALQDRVESLAMRLREAGVGPSHRVAVCAPRGPELVAGILGVLSAGGAYVPLDPEQPTRRLVGIVEDLMPSFLVAPKGSAGRFEEQNLIHVSLEESAPVPWSSDSGLSPGLSSPAYVLTTSGSSGRPKGVEVLHRNLDSFLRSMDGVLSAGLQSGEPPVFLAVTQVTFDIAVLELLWTLSRGVRVVLQGGPETFTAPPASAQASRVRLSLYHFATAGPDPYGLLLESARFADTHGFEAIWLPERHFHPFGGASPNPAVAAAAVAAVTERVRLRAGSVVLPLHDPLRVAEEWAMVDALSSGRVGVSFASGWHPRDFVLAPQRFESRRGTLAEDLARVRRLWRGEALTRLGPDGEEHTVRVYPRPVQPELPVWLSAAGSVETFRLAGELGVGVLTHLLGQGLAELAEKLAVYRGAGGRHATLMVHTYVGETAAEVQAAIQDPLREYLAASLDLAGGDAAGEDTHDLIERACRRYREESGLFGGLAGCRERLEAFRAAGVDEVACLVDFGLPAATVRAGLDRLADLQPSERPALGGFTLSEQIERHGVTHMQCTPTLAAALLKDPSAWRALGQLRVLLLGGEPLSDSLVVQLRGATSADLYNLYGPTESTVWATCARVEPGAVSLGRPLANTRAYVLDPRGQLVPPGVTGELTLGGEGVVAGYVGRPESTAAAFGPDPFHENPALQMYRTGDRVRFLADGALEFLGRVDGQLKLRGHRIEPGEVEAAIAEHPVVVACAVARVEVAPVGGEVTSVVEATLAAYVVLQSGAQLVPLALRAFLAERLPRAYIPTHIVQVDVLPRTPHGKLDRAALPMPNPSTLAVVRPGAAPRGATERALAMAWGEVLGVAQVARDDSFFDLGGYSLQAVQVVARAREAFDVALPLRSLFEAPTVAGLAATVDRLRVESRAVEEPIPRGLRVGRLPMSFAQERMWFLHQVAPKSAAYHDAVVLRLEGELDVEALEGALRTVVRKHASLRSAFHEEDGVPVQVIAEPESVSLALTFEPLDALLPEKQEHAVMRHLNEYTQEPFDLRRAPPLRARLLRLSLREHVLVLVFHHIACDGWSLGLIVDEVAQAYALPEGEWGSAPAAPRLDYPDVAAWRRRSLSGKRLEALLSYWRDQLAGAPERMSLPTDRRRPTVESFRGASERFACSRALQDALVAVGRPRGVTLFMTLLAGFQALLHHHTGAEDIVVGTDVANRTRRDLEGVVGLFTNQLVLRVDLEGDPTFGELLDRVREVALDAYEHQELPFDRLVEELQPERDLGQNPLFQLAFTLQEPPALDVMLGSVSLRPIEMEVSAARFDLEVNLHSTPGGLRGRVIYSTDLFDAATIRRLLAHYQAVLEAAVANPRRRLSELRPLLPEEKELLLEVWQGIARPLPEGSFSAEFAAQAEETPTALALVCGEATLTYGELAARAHRCGRALGQVGVEPERLVAVLAERGVEWAVCVLGVLAAGGAYLPLDSEHPPRRWANVIAQSRPHVLAVSVSMKEAGEAALALLPVGERPLLFTLGSRPELSPLPLGTACPEHSLAYVIFTSGSTGVPKGAMVEHAGLLNHLQAKNEDLAISSADVIAQTAPTVFDISVWQLLSPLLVGASVLIYPDMVANDPGQLFAACKRDGVTTLETVPSLLRLLLDETTNPGTGRLRWLLATGEALPVELCGRWLERFPHVPLLNAYGPAECSDDVTHHLVKLPPDPGAPSIPIGRPLPNTSLYVLDQRRQLAPLGAVGELYVGGVGVGRGYLNDSVGTAERFSSDPFRPDGRMYQTGDLVRWLPDGSLEFHGRLDHQVKLRGVRIELGEIEAALVRHLAVREAVVTTVSDEVGFKLAAYVVRDDTEDADWPVAAREGRVRAWQRVYERVYREGERPGDPLLNTIGWTSSYTGLPLSKEAMEEWVEGTVACLLSKAPQTVLEIGCGTGMLLQRLAPRCRRYVATDFSSAALEHVAAQVLANGLEEVELHHRRAEQLADLGGPFDLVVLNSVVQYFPGVAHLRRVLSEAIGLVAPGGRVFVGDVRSLPLLEAFHSSVEIGRAPAGLAPEALRSRIRQRLLLEEELVLDPGLFEEIGAEDPRVGRVSVELKPGREHNELTRFRYDVTLYVGTTAVGVVPKTEDWDWEERGLDLPGLKAALVASSQPALRITRIPNARLSALLRATAATLDGHESPGHVTVNGSEEAGVEPADLLALVPGGRLTWAASGEPDRMDLLLEGATPKGRLRARRLANDPLNGAFARQLAPTLREFLLERLPPALIPSSFTLLEALPLGRTGKVDRRALPLPGELVGEVADYLAPQTEVEAILARIWGEVLGLERVGVRDNFFALGGDSISSIQIVSRARRAGLQITVRETFQHQTVAALSQVAETGAAGRVPEESVEGPCWLTAIQDAFLSSDPIDPQHFNQALLLELTERVAASAVEAAIAAVAGQHDVLRLRFSPIGEGEPRGRIAPRHTGASEVPLTEIDLSALPRGEQPRAIEHGAAEEQLGLDLEVGPLLRAVLFELGPMQAQHLLLVAHHLVVDGLSWRVLLSDLHQAIVRLQLGELPDLGPRTLSLQRWGARLRDSATLAAVRRELPYWREQTRGQHVPLPGPAWEPGWVGQATRITVRMDRANTSAMSTVAAAGDALLLTALLRALQPWTGRVWLTIHLEGHGRTDPRGADFDLSRTVGWLSAAYPLRLHLGHDADPTRQLQRLRTQLQSVPSGGLGYGLLVRAGQLPACPVEVAFNNFGHLDVALLAAPSFRLSRHPSGPTVSPRARLPHRLEVDAFRLDGQLELQLRFGPSLSEEIVSGIGERTLAEVELLLAAPTATQDRIKAHGVAHLSQAELEAALDEVEFL